MSKLTITGIDLDNHWTIHRNTNHYWKAWISDERYADTGTPLLTSIGFEELVELIHVYEAGVRGDVR